jgi:hypothetical protein
MKDRLFKTTKEIEQSRTLWERGTLLAERVDGYHKILLYQLHDVYIEVTWHTHFNVIQKVSSFTSTDHLEPYLEDIDITGVFGVKGLEG